MLGEIYIKIIRDLVHGYIEIDSIDEEIINTLNFQRLKDIRQLTAQHVFPTATHTRFEHSLGVMYLSCKAISELKKELGEQYDYLYYHLKYASLLHDIGHAPFSHLCEKYYRIKEIRSKIIQIVNSNNFNIDENVFDIGSPHELMSCYIILRKFAHILQKGYNNLDLELICRCIVGNKYDSTNKWKENVAITILNSNTIDTDKLDYLLRDAFMTGVNVPSIDTTRLFVNICINPNTNTITFKNRSMPVIQNIIDSRDSMYLWAYNHHTSVYTDFIIEFYIKHLIANYEKNTRFEDKLDPDKFFSCEAICDSLISDSDVHTKLKEPIYFNPEKTSAYTKKLFPQLFQRKFLKPLWKTIYEFKEFLDENVRDSGIKDDLVSALCQKDYAYRRYIANEIIRLCKINHGDFFIIPRSNKFYSLADESIFKIHIDGYDKDISKLLPQKDFSNLYKSISFYVFSREENIVEVKKHFIDIIRKPLPPIAELPDDATNISWLST